MDKVLLVIPAFNEEKNIERVVEDLVRGFGQLDYVVVNEMCIRDRYTDW